MDEITYEYILYSEKLGTIDAIDQKLDLGKGDYIKYHLAMEPHYFIIKDIKKIFDESLNKYSIIFFIEEVNSNEFEAIL